MKVHMLGTGAGLPSKIRNTQSIILNLIDHYNTLFMIDAGEAIQHRILHTSIKPSKVSHIFITHLHGDHIYGLPGFIASRAHQGGQGIPLYIFGPKGLEDWVKQSLKISESYIDYPIYFYEVTGTEIFTLNKSGFKVITYPLDHGVDSFMYTFIEPSKIGRLHTDRLKEIGIEPGPIYSKIKASNYFTHEGVTYKTHDFLGESKPGRKITIHGDTRPIRKQEYLNIVNGSDLIVHESTYLAYEHEKAHQYYHSEIHDVLNNFNTIKYRHLLINHISNRYDELRLQSIREDLPEHVTLAYDFMEITIPRHDQ